MRYEDNSQAGGIAQGQAPDARGDSDALTAGTKTPAEGNVITGEGTKFGPMSSDQADGAHITKVAGAGGEDSSLSNGKLQVQGEFGQLTMDAQGNYHYTPKANVPENSKDIFTYTLADNSGRTDTADLTIEFGKTPPVVRADAQQIIPGPDGVVVLPEGVQLSDVMVVGRNLVINLPDGTQMVIVDGAVFVPQLVLGGVEVPPTNLATLLIDSEPTPAAGTPPPSSGGNFEVPVPPLDPGVPLGDLIPPTDMNYTPPEVEEIFPEEPDNDPTISIDPGDGVPVINAIDQVSELGLPTRNEGEPAGSGESADGNVSDNDDPSEATTGSILYDSPDGVDSITVTGANGVPVEAVVGAVIVGDYGTMTITSVVDGVITYNYVLSDNTSGNDTHDDFVMTITDTDGDSATATLQVNIVDDVPNAVNDSDSIASGQYGPATGNVITDASAGDAGDGDSGADTVGADDAHITSASGTGGSDSSFDEDGNLVINGQYGVLTLNEDGSYSYVRNEGTPGGVSDVFTYTLTDGDGDTDTATLTINIADAAPVTGENASAQLDDDALANGNPGGTGDDPDASNTSGTLAGSGGDGPLTWALSESGAPAGFTYDLQANGDLWVLQGGTHVLTVTLDASNGQYSVEQVAPIDHSAGGNENNVDFTINYTVSDVDGDSAAGSLAVNVDDDTPTIDPVLNREGAMTLDETLPSAAAAIDIGSITRGNDPDLGGGLAIGSASSGSAIVDLNASFGADGAAAGGGIHYELNVTNASSGLTLTDGSAINLVELPNGVVVGVVDGGAFDGQAAFAIAIDPVTGVVTVEQYLSLDHPVNPDPNDPLGLGEGTLSVVGTATDGDGDTVSTGDVDISNLITFLDDGPRIDPALNADATVTVDESLPSSAPTIDLGSYSAGNDPDLAGGLALGHATSGVAVVDAHAVFGADGPAAGGGIGYALSITNADSGLTLTDGTPVSLVLENGVIVGVVQGGDFDGQAAFAIAIDPVTGVVTVEQYLSLDHPLNPNPNDPLGLGDNTVAVVVTATDGDGDPVSSDAIDISGQITFLDDGPSIDPTVNAQATVTVDESLPSSAPAIDLGSYTAGNDPDLAGGLAIGQANSGVAVVDAHAVFGADGPDADGGIGYALSITNADSGLTLTDGTPVSLVLENGVIVGVVQGGDFDGQAAFAISIDPVTGVVTVEQYLSLDHPVNPNPNDPLGLGENTVAVVVTATDGDGDSVSSDAIDISGQITFLDDGPSIDPAVNAQAHVTVDESLPSGTPGIDLGGIVAGNDPDLAGGLAIGQANSGVAVVDANAVFGADGPAAGGGIGYELSITNANPGVTLTDGTPIQLQLVNGVIVGVVDGGDFDGQAAFAIAIDPVTGVVTVEQYLSLDHPVNPNPNDPLGLGENTVAVIVTATDGDGDSVSSGAIDISGQITFLDDGPDANNDVDTILNGGESTDGNVITGAGTDGGAGGPGADVGGADGFGGITAVTSNNEPGNTSSIVDGEIVIEGQYGTLTLDPETGAYEYERFEGSQGGVSDVFTYTLVDGDGDGVTATLTISIEDNVPQLATPAPVLLDDDALTGGNPNGTGDDPNSQGTPGQLNGSGGDGDLDYFFSGSNTLPAGFSVNVVNAGQIQILQGATVVLTITLDNETGAYSVVQNNPIDHAAGLDENNISFSLGVYTQDADGDTASSSLSINVDDDTPLANNDSDSIAPGGNSATGNVISGVGTTEGAANADHPGADGFGSIVGLAGSGGSDTNPAGGFTVTGTYGSLQMDANGNYTYTRAAGTPGGVSESFTYTYVDGDGDTVSATLTINIGDATPQLATPDAVLLDDDALAGGNPGGTGDDVNSQGTPGQLVGSGGDGDLDYFFSGSNTLPAGFSVNLVNASTLQILQGATVVLTITLNNETGAYSVVQNNPIDHASGLNENNLGLLIGVYTQDVDGDTASASLSINVDDDTPLANNDTDTITSGGNSATGNVITGSGTVEGTGNADSPGADGFDAIVGLAGSGGSDTDPTGGFDVVGSHGTLHMNADGSYTYTRTDGAPGNVSDVFTYIYRDGDGDTVAATLTINIQDAAPQLATPAPVLLDDDALAGGNAGGTGDDINSQGTPGQLAGSGGDGDLDYFFSGSNTLPAGFSVNVVNAGQIQILQGATVVLTITLDNETGSYTVVQNNPIDHAVLQGENNTSFSLGVYVTDADGDTAVSSLSINVDDDTPLANNDVDTIASGGTSATGNVITGVGTVAGAANADHPGADGFDAIVGLSGSGGSDTNPAGGFTVTGTYGSLQMAADGTYTYTRAAGSPGGVSDTFTYTYQDGDGDTVSATLTIQIGDATPSLGTPATALLDDDAVTGAGGNPGGTGDDVDAQNLSGSLAGSGGDGDLDYFFSGTNTLPAGFTTNVVDASTLQILQGATVVLTIHLNLETGAYSVEQNNPIDHAAGLDENNLSFLVGFYTQDADGDTASASLTINVDDDTPTLGTIQNQTVNNDPTQTPAVGTLHFSDGADGPAASMVITATTAGITSGGYNLVTNQVGNVLTAYTDVNGNGTYEAGTDATAVFTITVDPNAGTSGQYTFNLLTALDPTVTPFDVASEGAFGAGPTDSIIVTNDNTGDNVVFVTGYVPTGGFTPAEIAAWQAGGIPTLTQESEVNGSTQGWGLYNNNFNGGEFLRFDFGALNDYDGPGGFTPPGGVGDMAHISYATFTYFQFGAGEQVLYVVHYSDGSSAQVTVNGGPGVTSTTLNAPAGLEIDWVDVYMSSGDIKLNLGTIGIISEDIDETINVNVTLGDGDGDSVSGGFTVSVSDGNTPAPPALARALGYKEPANTNTSTNTGIVAGAAAAVGMAALPAAADQAHHVSADHGDAANAASSMSGLGMAIRSFADDGDADSLANFAGGHAIRDFDAGREASSARALPNAGDADLAGASSADAGKDAGPQVQADIDLPADMAAAVHAAPVVNMPAAAALQAAGLAGHAPSPDAIAQVVADALGMNDGPTVDHLLAGLGNAHDIRVAAVRGDEASAMTDSVQSWDMGGHMAFAPHADMLMKMDAMVAGHHDAVPPSVNG